MLGFVRVESPLVTYTYAVDFVQPECKPARLVTLQRYPSAGIVELSVL
jgi:hypothetical protein